MYEVRIKVIGKDFHPGIADEYLLAGEGAGACPLHDVGDEFIYHSDNEKPDGLCATAWLDICRSVTAIANGASYDSWNKNVGQTIACCGDGVRPVIFEITRIG